LTHCVGSANATTPKVAIPRSIWKPEESDFHNLLTFCPSNCPYDYSVYLSSSSRQG
jgi:hypothetical protein